MFATIASDSLSTVETANTIASTVSNNLITTAITVITIIATWKIFTKAKEQGWKAIIPCYNKYVMFKLFWKTKWFWASMIGLGLSMAGIIPLIVTGLITAVQGGSTDGASLVGGLGIMIIALLIFIAGFIFGTIIDIILKVRLSKSFGHGGGFACGLIFLEPIFLMILAFNGDKYKKLKD